MDLKHYGVFLYDSDAPFCKSVWSPLYSGHLSATKTAGHTSALVFYSAQQSSFIKTISDD